MIRDVFHKIDAMLFENLVRPGARYALLLHLKGPALRKFVLETLFGIKFGRLFASYKAPAQLAGYQEDDYEREEKQQYVEDECAAVREQTIVRGKVANFEPIFLEGLVRWTKLQITKLSVNKSDAQILEPLHIVAQLAAFQIRLRKAARFWPVKVAFAFSRSQTVQTIFELATVIAGSVNLFSC